MNRRLSGQSLVEYIVVAAIALSLLAAPLAGGPSALEIFLEAVRVAYQRFLAALSLPQ